MKTWLSIVEIAMFYVGSANVFYHGLNNGWLNCTLFLMRCSRRVWVQIVFLWPGRKRVRCGKPVIHGSESLFLRKLKRSIQAPFSGKLTWTILIPSAPPIRPRHLVSTQQGDRNSGSKRLDGVRDALQVFSVSLRKPARRYAYRGLKIIASFHSAPKIFSGWNCWMYSSLDSFSGCLSRALGPVFWLVVYCVTLACSCLALFRLSKYLLRM